MHFQAQVKVEGGNQRRSWEQWNVHSIYEACGKKTCVKSIKIESDASHLPAGEASVRDAKRFYWRVGREFY